MIELNQIITIDAHRDFTVERFEGEGSKQVAVGTLQRVTKDNKPASPQTIRYAVADLERVVEKALYTEGEFNSPDGARLVIKKVVFPNYVVEATDGIETKKGAWTHDQISKWMKAHIKPADVHTETTSDSLELEAGRKLDLHGHPVTTGFVSPTSIQIISADNENIRHLDREVFEQYLKDGYFKVGAVLANDNEESVDYATVLSRIGDIYTVKLLTPGAETTEAWTGRALANWLFSEPESNPAAHVDLETAPDNSFPDKIAELTRELEAAIAERDAKAEALEQANEIIRWMRSAPEREYKSQRTITDHDLNQQARAGWSIELMQFDDKGLNVVFSRRLSAPPAPKGNGLDKTVIADAQPAIVENGLLQATSAQAELRATIAHQNRAIYDTMVEATVKRAAQLGITEVYHAAQ